MLLPAGGLLGWVTPRLRWGQRGGKQCGLTAMHAGTARPQQRLPGLVTARNHLRGFRTAADPPAPTHTHARARTLPASPVTQALQGWENAGGMGKVGVWARGREESRVVVWRAR